ncbi:hypothetical protein EBZ38_13570, partial [bacterium]|nr:hypothetical protein [bacterium]NDD85286.1 hypothetical protein [bacterium]
QHVHQGTPARVPSEEEERRKGSGVSLEITWGHGMPLEPNTPTVVNQYGLDPYRDDYTMGERTDDETTLVARLDELLKECGQFQVWREVPGHLMHPMPGQSTAVRIDRLLRPSNALIAQGWKFGVIGIEAKRGGEKVGPALAQMVDYRRSLFSIDGGITLHPSYVLLWPWRGNGGPSWSQCIQQRLGAATPVHPSSAERDPFTGHQVAVRPSDWDGINFRSGDTFAQLRPGRVIISNEQRVLAQGRKTGSR